MTHDVSPREEIAHVPPEHGRGAAFFDLDRTLMAGSSGLHWARAARGAGLLTRRRMARYGWENVKFRLKGSTDQATDRVRKEVGEMIAGQRVVDLQRLAPKVLAGVLPRLYPQMLEVAHAQSANGCAYLATPPARAAEKALEKAGLSAADIDLWEINEAFASVTLNSIRMLGIDEDRVNVNGGAVALGHPIGASGARILGALVHELRRRGGGLGCAAICSGGGQGDAVILRVHGNGA